MPKASIIVPAFNAAQYIGKTLDSILNQSFQDFEVVIIDDGSSDETASIISQYDDPRIRYFHQDNSGKPAIPRNRAIQKARGEFVFIFDSDDIMLPGKLATTVECMEKAPKAGLAFTGFACIDEVGHVINPDFLAPYKTLHNLKKSAVSNNAYLIQASEALKGLAVSNYLGTSGVAIRHEVFEQVGGFDEDVRNSDDYLMWQAVASRYDFIYIPGIFHQYRVRSGSISLRSIQDRAPGLIACTEKMMQYHKGDTISLNHLRQRVGRFHFEVGYSHFKQQSMALARKSFFKALVKRKDRISLFYLFLSCLPPFVLNQLKQLKATGSNG
ncbi:glycosyltransferase family 2 protein [Marinobacter litoralis]|uniref:glycosyltransferase family 2 protein n=1 Tax=Marinobacter litoralis TaxID=187981 RepID=UPI0018EBE924|nr:glycosyltransferase family A protein [Marinobacter litoralis]MBJ6137699.1 glycosyltransferase family 2 protein [Marinobacter litoralis]